VRVLEDIKTGDTSLSGGRRQEAGEDPHSSSFAGAIGAKEAYDFTFANLEGNIVDRDMTGVALGQTFDFDHSY
jgi:hypothetical protein